MMVGSEIGTVLLWRLERDSGRVQCNVRALEFSGAVLENAARC